MAIPGRPPCDSNNSWISIMVPNSRHQTSCASVYTETNDFSYFRSEYHDSMRMVCTKLGRATNWSIKCVSIWLEISTVRKLVRCHAIVYQLNALKHLVQQHMLELILAVPPLNTPLPSGAEGFCCVSSMKSLVMELNDCLMDFHPQSQQSFAQCYRRLHFPVYENMQFLCTCRTKHLDRATQISVNNYDSDGKIAKSAENG